MININKLPNQERGEITKIFLRRHWITVLGILGYAIMFALAPIVLLWLLGSNGIDIFALPVWGEIISVVGAIYVLIVVTIITTQFTDYYLDTWIITTERIINIEQHGLFSRIISTLHLNQVQDVTAETHGFFATILTYGDVYIQTAGTRERFNFKGINDPEEVKTMIITLVEADKLRHGDASQPGVVVPKPMGK